MTDSMRLANERNPTAIKNNNNRIYICAVIGSFEYKDLSKPEVKLSHPLDQHLLCTFDDFTFPAVVFFEDPSERNIISLLIIALQTSSSATYKLTNLHQKERCLL